MSFVLDVVIVAKRSTHVTRLRITSNTNMRVWHGISFRIKPMSHSIISIERKKKMRRVSITSVISFLIVSDDCRSIQSDRHASCQSAHTSWHICLSAATEKRFQSRTVAAFTVAVEHCGFTISTTHTSSNVVITNADATQQQWDARRSTHRLSSAACLVILLSLSSRLANADVSATGSITAFTADQSSSSC